MCLEIENLRLTWFVQARESIPCVCRFKLCVPAMDIREVIASPMVESVGVVGTPLKVCAERGHDQVIPPHFKVALGIVNIDESPLEVDPNHVVINPPGHPVKDGQPSYGELIRVESDPRLVGQCSHEHRGPAFKSEEWEWMQRLIL